MIHIVGSPNFSSLVFKAIQQKLPSSKDFCYVQSSFESWKKFSNLIHQRVLDATDPN